LIFPFECLSGIIIVNDLRITPNPHMSLVLVGAYFLVLLLTFFVSSKTVQSPWLFLFRAFFPNWKFYHSLGWQPQLYMRVRAKGLRTLEESSKEYWVFEKWIYPRARRHFFNLVHNPLVNISLANQNMVEHLANDLQHSPTNENVSDWVSYKIVKRIVDSEIQADKNLSELVSRHDPADGILEYRFEIILNLNDPEQISQPHTLMLSPFFKLSSICEHYTVKTNEGSL
jgi:hypothetical protein